MSWNRKVEIHDAWESIVTRHAQGESAQKIADSLGCSYDVIRRLLISHDAWEPCEWEPRQDTLFDFAELQIAQAAIEKINENLPAGPLRDDIFDAPPADEFSAYLLGLISADGTVSSRYVAIALKYTDAGILAEIRQRLNYPKRIYVTRASSSKNGLPPAKLDIGSVRMARSMQNLGLSLKAPKSATVLPWKAPTVDLQRHYWRGVVDGDGHVGLTHDNDGRPRWQIQLAGNLQMTQAFADFCTANIKRSPWANERKRPTKHKDRKSTHQINFAGTHTPREVAKLLYENATIALERKLTAAKTIIESVREWREFTREGFMEAFERLEDWDLVAEEAGICKAMLNIYRQRFDLPRRIWERWEGPDLEELERLFREEDESWDRVAGRLGMRKVHLVNHVREERERLHPGRIKRQMHDWSGMTLEAMEAIVARTGSQLAAAEELGVTQTHVKNFLMHRRRKERPGTQKQYRDWSNTSLDDVEALIAECGRKGTAETLGVPLATLASYLVRARAARKGDSP